MPRATWNGPRVTRAITWVITRDHARCWLCGHTGANSLDHVMPASTHPHLEWEPTNWRAAHLHPAGNPSGKGCAEPGCTCPGNTGRRAKPWTAPPSRPW